MAKVEKEEVEKKEEEDEELDSDDQASGKQEEAGGKKLSRSEKKRKKAFTRIGMTPLSGITRVTLKRRDKIVFYVDQPEILKSGTSENSYVILGELKMLEQGAGPTPPVGGEGATPAGAAGLAPREPVAEVKGEEAKKPAVVVEEAGGDDEDIDIGDLSPDNIEMVMQHASCSKKQAVQALKEANGDLVTAVMKVSG